MRDLHKGEVHRRSTSDRHSIPVRRKIDPSSSAHIKNRNVHGQKFGALATKHSVSRSKIYNAKWYSKFIDAFAVVLSILRRTFYTVYRLLKPLPWKIIIPTVLGILLLLFAVFHFYLASLSRVTGVIESNYESSQILEEEINKTNVFLERIPPFSKDVQVAESALYNLNQSSQSASVSLPPKMFSSYAFRNDENAGAQVDTLYDVADNLDVAVLQRTTEQTSQLLNLSRQFFEKDIEQDTQSYIILIKDINKQLSDITNSGSELDVSTLQRIFQQVLNSAEQYELTNDIKNFNQQTNNVSSEIYKVIYQSWNEYTSSVQANLSTFRSSTESIIFAQ